MTDHEKELRRLLKGADGLLTSIACQKVSDLNRFGRIKSQRDSLRQKVNQLQKEEKK